MYSRSYLPDGSGKVSLPENYDGCAFREESLPQQDEVEEISLHKEEYVEKKAGQKEETAAVSLGEIPFLSGIFGKGSLLGGLNLRIPTIGTEEILLIATAAFLFFSKNGDKEVALILLLLLLIN